MMIFLEQAISEDPGHRLNDLARSLGLDMNDHQLKSLPAGRHWHVRKPGEKGTLEISWHDGKLWMEVRENRRGEWIEKAAEEIVRLLSD